MLIRKPNIHCQYFSQNEPILLIARARKGLSVWPNTTNSEYGSSGGLTHLPRYHSVILRLISFIRKYYEHKPRKDQDWLRMAQIVK